MKTKQQEAILDIADNLLPAFERAFSHAIEDALFNFDARITSKNAMKEPFESYQLKPHPDFVDQMIWQSAYDAAISGRDILNAKICAEQALQDFRERFPK